MTRQRIAVIGAGGFAREVKWLLSAISAASSPFDFIGFLVSDISKLGEHDSKDEVLGDLSWLRENSDRVDALTLGIGNPVLRSSIGRSLSRDFPTLIWPALLHPTVEYDSSCTFGKGVLLCAGVIATVNVEIEDFAMVNLSCTIGHEAVIGRGSVLNPSVNVSGGVEVGHETLVGTGAQILQYVHVGDRATVGAGAVVTKNVEPNTTVVGIPAKPLA